jgi:hypothetical protein
MSRPEKREEAHARVERELRQAKAEALGRLGERLDGVLARVAALDLELRVGTDPGCSARPARVAARARLRDEAAALVHALIIQREALGLVHHRAVADQYPLPPRAVDGA